MSEELTFIKQLKVSNESIRTLIQTGAPADIAEDEQYYEHSKRMLESIEKIIIELEAFKAAQHHGKVLRAASHL